MRDPKARKPTNRMLPAATMLEQWEKMIIMKNFGFIGDARVKRMTHILSIGPIGSRNDTTTFMRDKDSVIYVSCGCFFGTIDAFQEKVNHTHGDSKHAKAYTLAVCLARLQLDTEPIKGEETEAHADEDQPT